MDQRTDPLRRQHCLRGLHGQVEPARRRHFPATWLAPTPPAGAGSTWAAATARSRRCWSSVARRRSAGHRSRPIAQLAFARTTARGRYGRSSPARRFAMALPFADGTFDAAVMALVIFFVPDPVKGVAEMARVVRPGGSVSAYAWTCSAAVFPLPRCRRRWQRSACRRCGRRACRRRASRPCARSRRAPGSQRRSTRWRSAYQRPSTTSIPSGRSRGQGRASPPGLAGMPPGEHGSAERAACASASTAGCRRAHHLPRTRQRHQGPRPRRLGVPVLAWSGPSARTRKGSDTSMR